MAVMLCGMRLRFFARALALSSALVAFSAGAEPAAQVTIQHQQFSPADVEIRAGASVRWINREKRTSHSVFFPKERMESERMLPEEAWERTFGTPGEYPYECGPHPEMKGIVRVLP